MPCGISLSLSSSSPAKDFFSSLPRTGGKFSVYFFVAFPEFECYSEIDVD